MGSVWDGINWVDLPPAPESEADYAALRNFGRTTIGRTFRMQFGASGDIGQPARTVWQVISEDADYGTHGTDASETEDVMLHQSAGGRVQVKARIVREQGRVTELRFERLRGTAGVDASIERMLTLDAAATDRLVNLCFALRGVDPSSNETLKLDGDVLAALLQDSSALRELYAREPNAIEAVIRADTHARDVFAIAARRATLDRFEQLLTDSAAFDAEVTHGRREAVWQRFFEANPWLLGVGLTGQLLTSWSLDRLEQIVAGATIADVGKRADAVLATSTASNVVRSLVLAELKLHDDELLEGREYRSGTWAPSAAVTSGVAQALTTAERARDDLGSWLRLRDPDGYDTGEQIYAGSPRSFLVVGHSDSLTSAGRAHSDKVRSFELYRTNIARPEVLTYDEVLARARWAVDLLEQAHETAGDSAR